MELAAKFEKSIEQLLGQPAPEKIGVAVSGGGDSIALMNLMHRWGRNQKTSIHVATVDHGLRDGSAQEAKAVAKLCTSLGMSHDTLHWKGWDGTGNLQSSARQARYGLMTEWAAHHGIGEIALGHTLDDQAETVLMRLARGSGVDGLSAMPPARLAKGIRWLRPLLGLSRQKLREYLRVESVDWIEDPSNVDDQFERVRVREALHVLETLGIDAAKLADTANRLASARQVLERTAHDAAVRIATTNAGAVFMDRREFWLLAPETRRRLISHALKWVSNQTYPPRADALAELLENLVSNRSATLHGCLIQSNQSTITIAREAKAVAKIAGEVGEIWDGRWRIHGPNLPGLAVRATAESGLKLCANWRDTGLPRTVLQSTPAVWKGAKMIAAPMAGCGQGWTAELLREPNDFAATLLSH